MSDKAYKKIYVNGDCVVDFTKQTITEDTVSSDNLFFNDKGELITGKSDDFTFARASFNSYGGSSSSLGRSSQSSLRFSAMEYYGGSNAWSSLFGNDNFPCVQYLKTGRLTDMSTYDSHYNPPGDQKSIYFPKINVAEEHKSSFYSQLITNLYSQGATHQIFFEEDLSKFEITDYDPDLVISNCSNIKTSDDGAFDYIISNNKVYLLSINVEPSYTAANVTRDTTLELTNSSGDSITRDGWILKVPDTIEGLPVVSIGAGFFNHTISSYYGNNSSYTRWLSDCLKVELPSHLEIIGTECFVNFERRSSFGEILPGLKFPDTLRRIYGGPNSSYNTFIFGDSYLFTRTDSLPLPDFEKADAAVLCAISSYFTLDGSSSPLEYLPTKTNSQAYYIGTSESPAILVISEGCKGIFNIPSHVTSISIPESVTTLSQIRFRNQLTSITFNNNRTSMTELPTEFLYNCSSVTSFSIPEGITKLGTDCFRGCSALTSISIPEGITEIPVSFAYSCTALASIAIPEGVTKLGRECFRGCKLTDITLPTTLTYISDYAFYEPSGTAAKTIKVKAQTPPAIQHNDGIANNKTTGVAKIIVPQGCLDKYKTASNWSTWASIMEESTEW